MYVLLLLLAIVYHSGKKAGLYEAFKLNPALNVNQKKQNKFGSSLSSKFCSRY